MKKEQFKKFMEIFFKIQVNIPFGEALEKVTVYVKFMKEIYWKKKYYDQIALNKECSGTIQ